jgi:hypothetical protein
MMRTRDRVMLIGLLAVGFSTVGLPAANAYIDPGAGSFIFQAIVGGLLAIAVGVKVFWRRIVAMVTGRGRASATPDSAEPSTAVSDD